MKYVGDITRSWRVTRDILHALRFMAWVETHGHTIRAASVDHLFINSTYVRNGREYESVESCATDDDALRDFLGY